MGWTNCLLAGSKTHEIGILYTLKCSTSSRHQKVLNLLILFEGALKICDRCKTPPKIFYIELGKVTKFGSVWRPF